MAWIDDIQKLECLESLLNRLLQIKGEMPIIQAQSIVNTVINDYKSYLKVRDPNMKELTDQEITILQYVINTGGAATKESLFEDFEPLGPLVWPRLHPKFIGSADGFLFLTSEGENKVLATKKGPSHDQTDR